jgi:hypothetical protein
MIGASLIAKRHGEDRARSIGIFHEVVFFIERQNVRDTLVHHDDAVDDVTDPGMISQNALSNMVEEFAEICLRTDIEKAYFKIFESALAGQPTFYPGDSRRCIFLFEMRMLTISVSFRGYLDAR